MSEWTSIPFYLLSFLRLVSSRGEVSKYKVGDYLIVPSKDFETFVYERAFGKQAVSLFPSHEDLRKALKMAEQLEFLTYRHDVIVMTPENLKYLKATASGTAGNLSLPNVPDYSKEIIRRIYMAGLNEDDISDEQLLKVLQRKDAEGDSLIAKDFQEFTKSLKIESIS